MRFADLSSPSLFAADLAVADPRALFERAGAMLGAETGADPRLIARTLAEREALGSTGFGNGVAIPHGRVPGLARMAAALLRPARPLDWQAVDGLPVTLAVVLIGPEDAGVEHLKALALASRMMRDRALVARLLGAANAGAMWALVSAGTEAEAA